MGVHIQIHCIVDDLKNNNPAEAGLIWIKKHDCLCCFTPGESDTGQSEAQEGEGGGLGNR